LSKLYREKVKQSTEDNLELESLEFDTTKTPFKNRMGQWRALRKINESLSKTPVKRAVVLSAYTKDQKSPTVQILRNMNVIKSSEEENVNAMNSTIIENILFQQPQSSVLKQH
jgi:ribosomal protein S12